MREESGFSMIEVAVTIGILGLIVASMSAALGNGFKYLLHAKQRSAATQAANAMIERARAIAQSDWTQLGLVASDVAGDPAIVAGSCGGAPTSLFSGEPIVTAGTATSNPLYPHVRPATVGATTVTLRTYVTGVSAYGGCSASNPTYKRVTVVASWAKAPTGVPNTIRIATYLSPVSRPANPDFQGTASYSSGSMIGSLALPSKPVSSTGVFPPQSTADGRSVGQIVTYKGAGISALGQVDGSVTTATHTAETAVDDDALTAGIPQHACDPNSCGTPPDCAAFTGTDTWSVFLGGLASSTIAGTASSCSSISDATDDLPITIDRASMSTGLSLQSTVPAGGILPEFPVDNIITTTAFSTASSVDRSNVAGQSRITSTASVTVPTLKLLRFNVPAILNVPDGVVQLDGVTFIARAHAGQGAPAPSISGAITFRIFDPAATVAGCTSRSGSYCLIQIDPSIPGFAGLDRSISVTVDVPSILPTSRFVMTTTIKAFVPSTASSVSGGSTTQATMSYALPTIVTAVQVESPVGTTLATVSDAVDLGRLVTAASYAAPS
ncbi:MAG: type IV pilus modification PilV family protein [Actinomycetota bacterium]